MKYPTSKRSIFSPRTTGRRGFTLIELLVVIAVIAILAAVTFPTAGAIRQRSTEASAVTHVRQSALGLLNVALDNNGVIETRIGGSGGSRIWPSMLNHDYDFGLEVFRCPLIPTGYGDDNMALRTEFGAWPFRVAFGMNYTNPFRNEYWGDAFRTEPGAPDLLNTLRPNQVRDPSSTVFIASTIDQGSGNGRYLINSHSATGSGGAIHLRYRGRAAVALFDGSARLATQDELGRMNFEAGFGPGGLTDRITFPVPGA